MSTVKERPILFNGDMVRAILDGRKTQTRRGLSVQPPSDEYRLLRVQESSSGKDEGKNFWGKLNSEKTLITDSVRSYFTCPYGKPGERLWVRESIELHSHGSISTSTYCADGAFTRADEWPWKRNKLPSIHMPRGLCRITLEITNVRVERLQDISEEDAIAEGVDYYEGGDDWPNGASGGFMDYSKPDDCDYCLAPTDSFRTLWISINGPESWKANPWVWVIEFKRIN